MSRPGYVPPPPNKKDSIVLISNPGPKCSNNFTIPVRYQMYYVEQKQIYYEEYQQKQQNIENNNTRNDTFIDIKPSSLASSRGQPPTEQSSITK